MILMNMSLVKINIEQACALVSEHFGLRHSERHPPVRSPSKEYDIAPYRRIITARIKDAIPLKILKDNPQPVSKDSSTIEV